MKGHIRRRCGSTWAIVLDVRDPQTGKRRRKWHSFTGTKREAQVECSKLIAAIGGGDVYRPEPANCRAVPRSLADTHGDTAVAAQP